MSFLIVASGGCSLDVSYTGGRYECEPFAAVCPSGYECTREGVCVPSESQGRPDAAASSDAPENAENDAAVSDEADAAVSDEADASSPPRPDAATPRPDAAGTPDAATPPDAAPPPPDAAPPPPDAGLPPPTTETFVATRDTQIYSPEPSLNFGHYAEIQCAARSSPFVDSPVLFGWDVSDIPDGATVVSATMRLTVSGNSLTSGQVGVFGLREDWVEGGNDGTPGFANYTERKPGIPWAAAGAKPPSRGSMPVAVFSPNQEETAYDVALPASLVQGWVDQNSQNFGVILTCPLGQDVTFYTRLGGGSVDHPRLIVTYRP